MKIELEAGDLYQLRGIIGHRLADINHKAKDTDSPALYRYYANEYASTFEVAVRLDKALLMTKEQHIRLTWTEAFPFPVQEVHHDHDPDAVAGSGFSDPRQLASL